MLTTFESTFITPPPTANSIILDVVDRGFLGGMAEQCFLETSDGREVECKNESGCLWVLVAKAPGENGYEGDCVFDDKVGPYWVAISLGQLCRLVGITVNGRMPPLHPTSQMRTEAGRRGSCSECFFDLSGRMSFFEAFYRGVTLETARRAANSIRETLQPSSIVKYRRHDFGTFRGADLTEDLCRGDQLDHLIVSGDRPTASQLDMVSNACLLEDVCPEALIVRVKGRAYHWRTQMDWRSKFGQVPGMTADCLPDRFHFLAQFPTEDTARRKQLEQVEARLKSFLPIYSLEYYDLSNGERCYPDGLRQESRIDPVVVDWVRRAPNRWLQIHSNNRFESPFGSKPREIVN